MLNPSKEIRNRLENINNLCNEIEKFSYNNIFKNILHLMENKSTIVLKLIMEHYKHEPVFDNIGYMSEIIISLIFWY